MLFRTLLQIVLSVIDFVAPTRTWRVKVNTKLWFDIDVLNAIRNRDKHYKKFEWLGKEIDKGNFKCEKVLLKKQLMTRRNFTLKKRMQQTIIILKNSGEL